MCIRFIISVEVSFEESSTCAVIFPSEKVTPEMFMLFKNESPVTFKSPTTVKVCVGLSVLIPIPPEVVFMYYAPDKLTSNNPAEDERTSNIAAGFNESIPI